MLPPPYSKAVLAFYHKKLEKGELSLHIRQLSAASFKDACLEVRRQRYSRRDEWPLKAYFREGADQGACVHAIDELPTSKFKPLVNFIVGKTITPEDKVVELVAWLIDYEYRPYDSKIDYSKPPYSSQDPLIDKPADASLVSPIENENGPQPIKPKPIEGDTKTISPQTKPQKIKSKRIIAAITASLTAAIVIIAAIIFWPAAGKFSRPQIDGQGCMVWAEDHYQPISCQQKVPNVQVIALDTETLYHFRKITRPETITLSAAGSLWYARYRGNYEFYTDSGYHPLDPNLRLRRVSENIIRQHAPFTP